MIGGADHVIPLQILPGLALRAAVRYLLTIWKHAVFQDGTTGDVLSFAEANFEQLREVFVYQDPDVYQIWMRVGAERHAGCMVHLLAGVAELTIVVDPADAAVRGLVSDIEHHLCFGIPSLPFTGVGRKGEAP